MKQILSVLLSLVLFAVVSCEVYFSEEFNDGEGWKDRWVLSTFKGAEAGDFGLSSGKYHADESDVGLKTLTDARFYQISAETKEFSNKDKTLVLQFSVKHEQGIDCGGGYVKILPAGLDQTQFNGDSEYNIMFGPDICGASKRTHFIVTYKGKNHLIRTDIRTESDTYSHVYTLILRPDQTFTVKIDNNEVRSGSLTADFDILPPKEIPDPSVSKPADWVDVKEIPDPNAQKPEGWDDIPAKIRDPEAQQPEEWDSELDGEWEAPLIDNPEYKGEWVAPMIPNPEYKGPWIHPKISNPDYSEDANIYAFDSNKYVGIEIWQVKAGSIFDNFLVTDDVSLAEEWAARTNAAREAEKEKAKADTPAPSADGSKTVEVEPEIESYDEEEELDGGHDEL